MHDRPITSPYWHHYEITGTVDEDADRIMFGGFLNGVGVLFLDDFSLEVREPGNEWESLAIANGGFESSTGVLTGWWTGDAAYSYSGDDRESYQDTHSLRIENAALPDALFEALPRLGALEETRPEAIT